MHMGESHDVGVAHGHGHGQLTWPVSLEQPLLGP